jgi:cytochrome b561
MTLPSPANSQGAEDSWRKSGDTAQPRVFHVLHGLNATIIMTLVVGHIAAGLYQHFFQTDDLLRRMWPGGKV